jgi:hypothetical protein
MFIILSGRFIMKNTRKILSVLLAVVMMLSVMSILGLCTSAQSEKINLDENPIVDMEFTSDVPIQVIENISGAYVQDWQTHEYVWCYALSIDVPGAKLTLTFEDGSTLELFVSHFNNTFMDSDGRPYYVLFEQDVFFDFSSNGWTRDGENYITISYKDLEEKIPVEMIDNPIESFEFTPARPIELVEGISESYERYDADDKAYNYYYLWNIYDASGNRLTVYFNDGTSNVYTLQSINGSIEKKYLDENDNALPYALGSSFGGPAFKDCQDTEHWTAGNTYSIKVLFAGKEQSIPVKILAPKYFPDAPAGEWYADAAAYNAAKGFISGYKDGRFGAADKLQRQDFVVILARIAGADLNSYDSCNLSDVDMSSYYGKSIAWAVANDIIKGYDNGKFGIGDPITREQVATILYRYSGSPDMSDAVISGDFSDISSISPFAINAMKWATVWNVITGKSNGTLAPTASASRAEIATIIMRMDKAGMFD